MYGDAQAEVGAAGQQPGIGQGGAQRQQGRKVGGQVEFLPGAAEMPARQGSGWRAGAASSSSREKASRIGR
ncbi:hypothetical protein ACFQU7_13295 [Pseudoroseomonas wenyumeiae]